MSRLLRSRSVILAGCLNQNHKTMIIIAILGYVSKGEGVHDSGHVVQSHWKPVYLDETKGDEILAMDELEISFAQCGSRARRRSAAMAIHLVQPITCGALRSLC